MTQAELNRIILEDFCPHSPTCTTPCLDATQEYTRTIEFPESPED